MHDVTPPSLDEIRGIVDRRRRTRHRATQGAVSIVALGALGYAGLRVGRGGTTELPIAAVPTPTQEVAPTPSPTATDEPLPGAEPTPSPTAMVACGAPGGPLPGMSQPGWLVDRADEFLLSGQSTEAAGAAIDLAAEWGVDAIEMKALLAVTGWGDPSTDTTIAARLDDLVAAFDDGGFDRADARAIAQDWNITPKVVRALAAAEEPTIVEALAACARI